MKTIPGRRNLARYFTALTLGVVAVISTGLCPERVKADSGSSNSPITNFGQEINFSKYAVGPAIPSVDQTVGIANMIAALPNLPGTFNGSAGTIYFPAGNWAFQPGVLIVPSGIRVRIIGDGPFNTILTQLASGAYTGDFITLQGANSRLDDVELQGYKTNSASNDGLVLNASYCGFSNIIIQNFSNNGVSVGKTTATVNCFSSGENFLRLNLGYGQQIITSGSTDSLWLGNIVSQNGKSGVRTDVSAQNFVSLHSWGNGLETGSASGDAHGLFMNGVNDCTVTAGECESNLQHGVYITGGKNNQLIGGKYWANGSNGVYGFNSSFIKLGKVSIYRNGTANVTSSSSTVYAGIVNQGSPGAAASNWNVDADCWDDGAAVAVGTYPSGYTPSFPFLGRSAIFTQTNHYVELTNGTNSPNGAVISGNMQAAQSKTGVAVILTGNNNKFLAHVGTQALPTIASAATLFLGPVLWSDVIQVSGTATISTITATWKGHTITLVFTNATPGIVNNVGNILNLLAGTWTPAQGNTITLKCDGTSWQNIGKGPT